MLPLYDKVHDRAVAGRGNRGLEFAKFFDRWPIPGSQGKFEVSGEDKKIFLDRFRGKSADASRAAERIKALAVAQGGDAIGYISNAPFITGTGLPHPVENGFLWHHSWGVPYLPGSSVKGMLCAWAQHWLEADEVEILRIFGSQDGAGTLVVFDAVPLETVDLYTEVITPHIGDWRHTDKPKASPPADWVSPVPIHFLAVASGAKFQFALAPRKGATGDPEADLASAWQFLEEALTWMGTGARTASGFGIFENLADQQAEAEKEAKNWFANLTDGDEAEYFGQLVRLRDVDHAEGKASLLNVEKNKGLGRKLISKLKPLNQ